jgi:hypothetical protein
MALTTARFFRIAKFYGTWAPLFGTFLVIVAIATKSYVINLLVEKQGERILKEFSQTLVVYSDDIITISALCGESDLLLFVRNMTNNITFICILYLFYRFCVRLTKECFRFSHTETTSDDPIIESYEY